MGGCPRAGTTRSSEMSPAQGRSSLAGTRALASVRVAVPYVTTFRGAGSCPLLPIHPQGLLCPRKAGTPGPGGSAAPATRRARWAAEASPPAP